MQEQEEIKVRSKVAKLLFGSLAFVLLGIGLIYAGAESGNFFILIIGFICTLFFALGLVFSVSKLFKSEPALLINQEGISRQPVWRQKLMDMNIGMTRGSIHLTSLNLSCSLYELFPLLYRRWNMHKSGTDQDIQEETIEK
ncbi:STM3941 family protein [Paenibacillus solani]|uniref:STM3941 family protein n=1 Tax=Paenibacillus solani TaxID=1705565 RepID=UPI003D2BB044